MITKLFDWFEYVLAVACAVCFALMFILGVATVFFRFVVDSSLAFPEELIRYLFVWATALGSAVAYRRNAHAAIGIVVDRLPGGLRRAGLLLATTASATFFAILLFVGIRLSERVLPQISPALEISMAWVYAAVPTGGLFLLLFAIELLVKQATVPASELVVDSH
ncbi:MAG: TRAP transporter small permease [Hyphomicrobiaceae bacterium]